MTTEATSQSVAHTAFLTWRSGVLAVLETPNGAGGRDRLVVQLGAPDQAATIAALLSDPASGIIGPQGEITFRLRPTSDAKMTQIELLRPLPTSDGSITWVPVRGTSEGGHWFVGLLLVLAILILMASRIKNHPKPKGFWGKTSMVAKWFVFLNPGDFRTFKPKVKPVEGQLPSSSEPKP